MLEILNSISVIALHSSIFLDKFEFLNIKLKEGR